jgi:hypothetical protein
VVLLVGVVIVIIAIAGHRPTGTVSLAAGSSPAATVSPPASTHAASAPRKPAAKPKPTPTPSPKPKPTPTPPQAAPATSAAPRQTQAAQPSCYPISDEGTCYEPGEYCRDDDHGASGIAGDGEAITCADNDGWRWEPS